MDTQAMCADKSHLFHGVSLKLTRARESLDRLESDIAAYVKKRADSFLGDRVDASGMRHVVYQGFDAPESVPIVAGEIVHHLRSSLDHAVWQLVRACGETPSGDNEFPIATTQEWFESRGVRKLAGLDDSRIAAIRSVQPFQFEQTSKGRYHALTVLNELWNIDKHRQLYVCAVLPSQIRLTIRVDGPIVSEVHEVDVCAIRPVSSEAVLYTLPLRWDGLRVEVTHRMRHEVMFAESFWLGQVPVVATLAQLIREVERVIHQLAALA